MLVITVFGVKVQLFCLIRGSKDMGCQMIRLSSRQVGVLREKLRGELEARLARLRRSDMKYHVVLALSGGKDSAYLAWLVSKRYKLRALGVTVDNGFMEPLAFKNVERVTGRLGMDHVVLDEARLFRKMYRQTFRQGFLSASVGLPCDVCSRVLPLVIERHAGASGIPLVMTGKFDLEHPQLWETGGPPPTPVIAQFIAAMDATRLKKRKVAVDVCYPLNTFLVTEAEIFRVLKKEVGISRTEEFRSEETSCEIVHACMYLFRKARGYNPHLALMSTLIQRGFWDPKGSQGRLKKLDEYLKSAEARTRALKVLSELKVMVS